jgi:hypothetical protein
VVTGREFCTSQGEIGFEILFIFNLIYKRAFTRPTVDTSGYIELLIAPKRTSKVALNLMTLSSFLVSHKKRSMVERLGPVSSLERLGRHHETVAPLPEPPNGTAWEGEQ